MVNCPQRGRLRRQLRSLPYRPRGQRILSAGRVDSSDQCGVCHGVPHATPFLVPVTRSYLRLCAVVIAIQILVGIAGFFFPVAASLAIADVYRSLGGAFEKLINGAPPMAPLLFPNLSLLALYALWAYSRFLPETGADTAVRTQLQAEGESNRRRLRIKGGHLAPYRPGSGLLSPSHLARKVVECRSRFRSAFVQKGRTHRREGRTRATVTIEGAEVRVLHRCRHKTLSPRHNRQQ